MLVYVAELLLDYLVRGPWRDPKGFNFPQTRAFSDAALLQPLFEGGRLHAGLFMALIAVDRGGHSVPAAPCSALRYPRRAKRRVRPISPGFNEKPITFLVFAISGALAGLAGVVEVAGQVGQLRPGFGQGLGFTAIIVAFLGRLSPVGAAISALVIAVSADRRRKRAGGAETAV